MDEIKPEDLEKMNRPAPKLFDQPHDNYLSQLNQIWFLGKEYPFEDGVRTRFAEFFEEFVEVNNVEGLEALRSYCLEKNSGFGIIASILKLVGAYDGDLLKEQRTDFLKSFLKHSSVQIQMAAAEGLSLLGDCASILHAQKIGGVCSEAMEILSSIKAPGRRLDG